jgi:serine/threonine-protein phosphatase 2A regulatory subunit A
VQWAAIKLLPKVLQLRESSNYLFRLTALSTVSSLSTVVGREVLYGSLLPVVLGMVTDVVPNVRFNVAKTLKLLVPLLEPGMVATQVKPRLKELSEDRDMDVQFFAKTALPFCG